MNWTDRWSRATGWKRMLPLGQPGFAEVLSDRLNSIPLLYRRFDSPKDRGEAPSDHLRIASGPLEDLGARCPDNSILTSTALQWRVILVHSPARTYHQWKRESVGHDPPGDSDRSAKPKSLTSVRYWKRPGTESHSSPAKRTAYHSDTQEQRLGRRLFCPDSKFQKRKSFIFPNGTFDRLVDQDKGGRFAGALARCINEPNPPK